MAQDDPKNVVGRFLEAIASEDGETMLALLDEDAVLIIPGSTKVPFNGRWQGEGPIKQCFRLFGEHLDIRDHTVRLMFGEGEHVFTVLNETSASKTTGRLIKQDTGWWFHVRGGKIVHWQVFEDTEQIAWAWDDAAAR